MAAMEVPVEDVLVTLIVLAVVAYYCVVQFRSIREGRRGLSWW